MNASAGVPIQAYPTPGTVINGRFRVDALLGEGGMGAVFSGLDLTSQLAIAVKFMSPEMAIRPGMHARFLNEAQSAASVDNEHVVKIFGYGEWDQGLHKTPFLVMELLAGRDLDQIVEREAPLDTSRAVHFGLQVLRALQGVHGAGLVHRDLKPSNCFVIHNETEAEFVKLIDFGITKQLQGEDKGLTRTATTLGTPAYMSPEQAKNAKGADARSDIYSVGVILYELLTRKRPFEGSSDVDLVVKICTEPPVPILSRRGDMPTGLATAIERALVKDPASRYSSVTQFAEALKPFADLRAQALLGRMGLHGMVITPRPPEGRSGSGTVVAAPSPFATTPEAFATLVETPSRDRTVATTPEMARDSSGRYATPAPPNAGPLPAALIPQASHDDRDQREGGGRGPLLVVLGLLAAGLIGTGIYLLVRSPGSGAPPPMAAGKPERPPREKPDPDNAEPKEPKRPKEAEPDEPLALKPTASPSTSTKPKPSAKPLPSGSRSAVPSTTGTVRPLPSTVPSPTTIMPRPLPSTSTLPTVHPTPHPTVAPTAIPSTPGILPVPGTVIRPVPGKPPIRPPGVTPERPGSTLKPPTP